MEWTFLNAPVQRVLRRVADDATIDATIDLVSSFATGEQVQLLRDIKAEREGFRSVLEAIRCLLADAQEKGYPHADRTRSWLGQVRDAVWDAEDVLDEYATDAALLHREWDRTNDHLFCNSQVWSYFSDKLKAGYQFDKVRGRLEDVVETGTKELGLQLVPVQLPPPVPHTSTSDDHSLQPAPAGGDSPDPDPQSLSVDRIRANYEHLAPNLQECFAYCSLYPQDYKFQKDELVQLWMAQGFLEGYSSDGSSDQAQQGQNKYDWEEWHLDRLVSASLLGREDSEEEESEIGQEDIAPYTMSDVARDLAASVSRDYCVMPGEELLEGKMPDRVRHFARVVGSYGDDDLPAHVLGNYEKLRTLFLSSRPEAGYPLAWSSSEMVRFLDEVVFTKFRRLRVLALQSLYFPTLPASIDNLRHLRRLDLSTSTVEELPESLGNLYNLQSLFLQYCFMLKGIPEGALRNLTNLRYLDLHHCDRLTELPESLGNLCSLQVLNLNTSRSFERLPESVGNLTNLVVLRAESTDIKRVPQGVGNLAKLRVLCLPATFEELPESVGNLRDLQVLWVRSGGMVKKLPDSLGNLTNLISLNLGNSGIEELSPWVFNLPKLRELNLTGAEESIPSPTMKSYEDAVRHLVNDKGVVFWYYGRHTSLPEQAAEDNDAE